MRAAPDRSRGEGAWYSYATVRVVPHVEREEFLNVGVVLFSRELKFLAVRLEPDEARLAVLAPGLDVALVREHLAAFETVARGDASGGSIASLSPSERFHWLTSPRSTLIQTSAVHVGRCDDPQAVLDELLDELVRPPAPRAP